MENLRQKPLQQLTAQITEIEPFKSPENTQPL